MEELIYLRNKKKNRQIAMGIIGIVLASQLFSMPVFVLPVVNMSLVKLASTVGLAWVLYGLWKHKLGQ